MKYLGTALFCSREILLHALLASVSAAAIGPLRADAPPPLTTIRANAVDYEGRRTYSLEWDASSNAVYRIQTRNGFESNTTWQTFDVVQPAGLRGEFSLEEPTTQSPATERQFLRVLAPQPEIFGVQPAAVSASGEFIYIIGQCFPSNALIYIDDVLQTNAAWLGSGLLRVQVTFEPPFPGTSGRPRDLRLEANGVTLAELTGAVILGSGSPVSQRAFEVPVEPPASPALKVKEKGNRTKCSSTLRVLAPTGELQLQETDLFIAGVGLDFVWTRTYRSRTGSNTRMGQNWTHSYDIGISPDPIGVKVLDGTGRSVLYISNTNGLYSCDEIFNTGTFSNDIFTLEFPDGGKWVFRPLTNAIAPGFIARIEDRLGNALSFGYDLNSRLTEIIDTLGRTNRIAYVSGRVSAVTDFSGRTVAYTYWRNGEPGGSNGDLRTVTTPAVTGTPTKNDFPEGKTTTYTYSTGFADERLEHNLLTITDPLGQTWFTVEYSPSLDPTDVNFDRVLNFLRGENGGPRTFLSYMPLVPAASNRFAVMKTIVNDPVGNVTVGWFDSLNRGVVHRDLAARAQPDTLVTETNLPTVKLRDTDPDHWDTTYEWNLDSLCTRVTFPRGNSTEFVYQRAFNQNASRGNNGRERRADGNPRVIRERACCGGADLDSDGDPDVTELVWRMEFDPRFGSPAMLCSAGSGWTFPRGPRQSTSLDGSRMSTVKQVSKVIVRGWDMGRRSQGWDGTIKGRLRKLNQKAEEGYEPWNVDDDGDGAVGNPLYEQSGSQGVNPLFESSEFVIRGTDPRGNSGTATFNERGSATALFHAGKSPDGSDAPTINLEYDSAGRLAAIVYPQDGNQFRRRDEFTYSPQTGLLRTWTVDAAGPTVSIVSFDHDARGNVTQIVDARGSTNRFIYNALDQIVRAEAPPVCNPCGPYLTDFFYDGNDNVVRIEQNNVDGAGVLDAANPTWTTLFDYDLLNRRTLIAHEIVHTPQQRFATNRFTYDAIDNVIEAFAPEAVNGNQPGNLVTYDYDTRRFLWRQTRGPATPEQSTDEFDYDANGNLSRASYGAGGGAGGTIYLRSYDGFDRCVSVLDPMGNTSRLAYDNAHNLILERHEGETNDVPGSVANRRLAETRYEYDSLDRRTRARRAFFDVFSGVPLLEGESITTFTFAANGSCVRLGDPKGNTTTYSYDTRGRLVGISDPKTNVISYTFDANDNLLSVTHADASDISPARQSFLTSYEYDAWNRCVTEYDNVANTNRYLYDSRDNRTQHRDARATWHFWEYDGLSRTTLAAVDLDGDGLVGSADVTTRQVWDDNSRLVIVKNGNSNETHYFYDALSRRTVARYPDSTMETLVWSPRSNLSQRADPNGTVTSYAYDDLNRCVGKNIIPGPGVVSTTTFEQFGYDGLSRCVVASNNVSLTEFSYDSLGNLVKQSIHGHDVLIIYDQNSLRTQLAYPGGRVVNYSYNAIDEITGATTSAGSGLPSVSLGTFAYDGPGRLSRIARGNGVNTRFTWNGLQNPSNAPGDFGWQQINLINHQASGGGEVIDRRLATYDRNQNKTLRQQTVPFPTGVPALTTNIFAYDALNRMKSFSRNRASSAHTKDISLDRNGNRLSLSSNGVAAVYGMDNGTPEPADSQMDQYTATPFGGEQHDHNGNLVSRDTAFGSTRFTYDYADRLVSVERSVGPAFTPVASFAYDALGRRIGRTTFPPAPADGVTTEFILDPVTNEVLEERENGVLKKTVVMPHVLEVSGRMIISANGDTFYSHVDDIGSTVALTDAGGKVLERYDYDEYGAPRFLTPEGVPMVNGDGSPTVTSPAGNDGLFRGLFWDGETELYFGHSQGGTVGPGKWMAEACGRRHAETDFCMENGVRYFDPRVGRWISRGTGGGNGRNAFTFAGDNPWSEDGGSSGGGTRRGQDVYVWKLCNCGKKGCKQCPKKKTTARGGGGSGGSHRVYFNPKEITLDKKTPWSTKKEEGGRHTPFHNKYEPESSDFGASRLAHEAAHVVQQGPRGHRDVGGYRGRHEAAMNSIRNLKARLAGAGSFGSVYLGKWRGAEMGRKDGDLLCGHTSHF